MKYSFIFLACFFLFAILFQPVSLNATPHGDADSSGYTTDTMVNYCKLVRAAYKYGLLEAQNKRVLTDADVKEFNDLWKEVFDVAYYQSGITNQEFTNPYFKEGNYAVFPPSVLYNPKNPDTYSLFHIGKEIGKINSPEFQNCPSCTKASIDKINELINKTGLLSQFTQLWLNVSSLKTFTSAKEITDFWQFLRCYSIDDRVNPKSDAFFISLPPVMRTPDTTIIHCKDEIKAKVSVGYRHCEIGGRIDTVGPVLVRGMDNCPNALYRITFTAKDFCNKSAKADQYFRIDNDNPQIYCQPDTIVDCIENFKLSQPQGSSSCRLNFRITSKGPYLVSGHNNCPDAIYKVDYTLKDSCGREAKCTRSIRIINDAVKISCPPDEIVTCFDKIVKGEAVVKSSCKGYKNITVSDPVLVKGNRNCNGSVYEITYSYTDSCGRKSSCVQKFTISNAAPKIKCPPAKDIACLEDIVVGLPESVQVSCDLKHTVTTTEPKLISGKPNCAGASYEVTYTVTDECGRKDSCKQLFNIVKDDLKITCPPDETVRCADEIKVSTATVATPCKLHYKTTTTGPTLVSGTKNCNGAVYQITYTTEDDYGKSKTCVQKFTISNDKPEISCGGEITLDCYDDIKNYKPPVPTVSCNLKFTVTSSPAILVSGKDKCEGARYKITHVVEDECGRKAECTQYFRIHSTTAVITCPPDKTVDCEEHIVAENPVASMPCQQNSRIDKRGPELIKGTRNCNGAVYTMTYIARNDCGDSVKCIQRFTIDNAGPVVTCPPDKIAKCAKDIVPDNIVATSSCGDKVNVKVSDLLLISGKANCPNAKYAYIYTVTDACSRTTKCTQYFTLTGDDLQVVCPPDVTVNSKAEIKPSTINVITSCGVKHEVTTVGPTLVRGNDGEGGSEYEIIYTITDDCGQRETCKQIFTLTGPAGKGNCVDCDCLNKVNLVPIELKIKSTNEVNHDFAVLLKKFGCKKLKEMAQSGLVGLWNAWSSSEILGTGTGIASDIARRGDLNTVIQSLSKIEKAIEIIEEALNGDPKKALEILGEFITTEGLTSLTGSGTPAAVFNAIKSLGEFAKYLNNEILRINIKTIAGMVEKNSDVLCVDYYLREIARIHQIKPGDRVTWQDGNYPLRTVIWEYAQQRLNINLGPITEVWRDPVKYKLLQTVVYTMLKEVCEYFCYKLTLKNNLNKLIIEQNLLQRFNALLQYILKVNCQGVDIKPDCNATYPNSEAVWNDEKVEYECKCKTGYEWNAGHTACVQTKPDCNTYYANSEAKMNTQTNTWECFCKTGYEWNADRTACVQSKPDCNTYYPNSEARLNPQTNVYECFCKTGYEWNTNHTACVQSKPDCNSYYPNSEAKLNSQTNVYECFCKTGYEWNTNHTACVQSKPDCNSYYPNSEAKLNSQTNVYECFCKTGYEWNTNHTACVQSKPNCNSYYPNSEAKLNTTTNTYECFCKPGFEWNSTRTACVQSKPDCNSYYPNSEAKLNTTTNTYECFCKPGFEWNSTRTACVQSKPDCNSYYPNSEAKLNTTTNTYECFCKPGFEWNSTRTACIQSKPDCNSYYPNSEAKLNTTTNTYECFCKPGFEWNSTRTACIQSKPDCNSYYANSEARLNPATNAYECYCKTGFEWNSTRTACVPSKPDCNTYYPNSEAKLNPQTNTWECFCVAGYQWNANRTACVPSAPDCNSYYANSEPRLNPQTNVYECYCKAGYQWNATRTACVPTGPDCASYYPNSEAKFNPQTNQYECFCKPGYQWNATRTACVAAQTPDCNSYYPNSEAKYNPQSGVYECYCKAGYEWNATRTACVLGNRDNPQVNPQQQKTGVCSTTYHNGANEPEQYTITMPVATGTVSFTYNTYTVKDRIHIYQGNSKIFDSGCVGTSATVNITLNGTSNIIRIVVDPLCEQSDQKDTAWDFNFGCPR